MDPLLQQIQDALNHSRAREHAHQVILTAILGQLCGSARDWRGRMEVMRGVAEQGLNDFQFVGNTQESDELVLKPVMKSEVAEIFEAARKGLLDWESKKPPTP